MQRTRALALFATLSFGLAACSEGDLLDVPSPEAQPGLATTSESSSSPGPAQVTVVEGIEDLGAPIIALVGLPNEEEPGDSQIVAALEGGGLAFANFRADPVFATATELGSGGGEPLPPLTSLIAAPNFFISRLGQVPLIAAVGPDLDSVALYLVIGVVDADEPPALEPVPVSQPIGANVANITTLCTVRATQASLDFLVIGETEAELWSVTFQPDPPTMMAELIDEAPEAIGATGCAHGGDEPLLIGPDGKFKEGLAAVSIASVTHRADTAAPEEYAVIARPGVASLSGPRPDWAPLYVADPQTGEALFALEVQAGINTTGVDEVEVIYASDANFGASYGEGLVLLADGATLSVVSTQQLSSALGRRAVTAN